MTINAYDPCEHPSDVVVADILEGDAYKVVGQCVQWCRRCGSYRRGLNIDQATGRPNQFGPWHEPDSHGLVGYPRGD